MTTRRRWLAGGALAAGLAVVAGVLVLASDDPGRVSMETLSSGSERSGSATTGSALSSTPFTNGDTATSAQAPTSTGHLQLEPPVRDVRVRIGTAVVSSDGDGVIAIPPVSVGAEVEVVVLGYSASPAVRQVRFLQWSDGDPAGVRTIDTSAPLPLLEVEVLHRVGAVRADGADTPVRFESAIGPVDLAPGTPTWVPALRPGSTDLIRYTAGGAAFLPTPEARWTVPSGT